MTPAFALLGRTLRMEMRSLGGVIVRTVSVLALIVALGIAARQTYWYSAPGLELFFWLVWSNFVLVGFVGVAAFAGVISDEKEERTLGLLRLAGFGSASILFGKSVGQLLTMTTLLAVQLPFAVLAVTLGGVSTRQVLAGYEVLFAFAFFVYGIGLVCSVICSTSASATRLAAGLVLACLIVPPFAVTLIDSFAGGPPLEGVAGLARDAFDHLRDASAVSGLAAVTRTGLDDAIVADVVATQLVIGGLATATAWLWFARSKLHDELAGRSQFGRRNRPRPAEGAWAFAWKNFHFTNNGWRSLGLRFVGYGVLAVGIWTTTPFAAGRARADAFGRLWTLWMMAVLALETVILAGQVFAEERRLRTLPSVALCPDSLRHSLGGQVAGSLPALLPAAGYLLFAALFTWDGRSSRFIAELLSMLVYLFAATLCASYVAALASLVSPRLGIVAGLTALVMSVGGALAVLIATGSGFESSLLLASALMSIPTVMLHAATKRRLQRAIAE